jgi:hypothetical protein
MITYDQVLGWANTISSYLMKKTPSSKKNEIFVSIYKGEFGKSLYSVRLNEFDNRINGLDLTKLFFLLDELVTREYKETVGGLKLSTVRPEIFWPKGGRIQGKFQRFCKMKTVSTNEIRKSVLFDVCESWAKSL